MELKINNTLATVAVRVARKTVKNPYCQTYCTVWQGCEGEIDRAQALYIASNGPFKGPDAKLARKILVAYGQRKPVIKVKDEEVMSWAM